MHHDSAHNQLTEALKTCKRAFAYTVFFGFVVSFLTLATSIYSMQVFDRVLSSGSYQTLIALTLIMVVFSIILNFMQAVRSSITNKAGEFIDKKLSALTIDLSFKSLKNDASKQTISQNIRDLHTIRNFIASQNLISVIDAPWSIIFIIVIFLIHPLVGATVLVGAFILLFLAYLNDKHTKKLSAKSAELSSHCYKELDVMAKNVEVISALKMKDHLINNWNEFNKKNLQTAAELHYQSNVISNITKFFRGLIYILTVAFGAYLVINNKMSSGGIMACSILSAKALMPFDAAISLWNTLLNTKKSYERLNKLINENYTQSEKITFPEPQGNLDIERVGYIAPRSSKPIIKGVNISIKAGEIVAIIGPTASGKSTLAKLLVGVANPSTGHIRLDGAELSHFKDEDLAKYIGYLPQDIELFNGSVKTNIARMDKKAKDEDIIAATKIANCHNMILKLDKAYETDIGVWGANISGGQRQRIALARAFYGNPKLVVLDEPNSNLDQEGEAALSACLKMAKQKNITVLIISHRQNIIEAVDKILVLHNGEAKLFGPKLEVLKSLSAKQIEG